MFSRRPILAFATIAIAAVLFVACGGGDSEPTGSPTPRLTVPPGTIAPAEELYFEQLQAEMAAISARFVELDESRPGALSDELTEAARIINVRVYVGRYFDLADDAVRLLDPIAAPPSLVDLHNALVDAFEDLIQLGTDLTAEMEIDPDLSEDDFADTFFDFNGVVLEQRVRDACFDLLFFAAGKDAASEIVCPR